MRAAASLALLASIALASAPVLGVTCGKRASSEAALVCDPKTNLYVPKVGAPCKKDQAVGMTDGRSFYCDLQTHVWAVNAPSILAVDPSRIRIEQSGGTVTFTSLSPKAGEQCASGAWDFELDSYGRGLRCEQVSRRWRYVQAGDYCGPSLSSARDLGMNELVCRATNKYGLLTMEWRPLYEASPIEDRPCLSGSMFGSSDGTGWSCDEKTLKWKRIKPIELYDVPSRSQPAFTLTARDQQTGIYDSTRAHWVAVFDQKSGKLTVKAGACFPLIDSAGKTSCAEIKSVEVDK